MIGELEKCKGMLVAIVKEHELIDAKKRLEEAAPNEENKVLKKAELNVNVPQKLKVGDEVKVLSYGQKGTLLEKSGKMNGLFKLVF